MGWHLQTSPRAREGSGSVCVAVGTPILCCSEWPCFSLSLSKSLPEDPPPPNPIKVQDLQGTSQPTIVPEHVSIWKRF